MIGREILATLLTLAFLVYVFIRMSRMAQYNRLYHSRVDWHHEPKEVYRELYNSRLISGMIMNP